MVEIKSNPIEGVRKMSKCLEECLFEVKIDKKYINDNQEEDQNVQEKANETKPETPSDFEDAISATGFGKFNVILILCSLPAFCTSVYVTSSLSYIMSSAECDLNMTMADMGRLNTFVYAGMFCSALVWGFLSDTLGRKRVMVVGFLSLTLIELSASQSSTYLMLSMAKFCAGLVFNGPFAILMSYISEMHKTSIRATVMVFVGVFFPFANMSLPLLAWAIIPREINLNVFGGVYELHSWQIFLALFSIPPLITGLAIMTLPESPKFLMSRGRNEEALKIFQRMFAVNTGRPESEYPIKNLIEERGDSSVAPSGLEAIKGGFRQLKPLFMPPHLKNLVLACFIYASTMYGGNTLRLWFPQISTIVENYYTKHTETASFCRILDSYVSAKVTDDNIEELFRECVKVDSGSDTYINSIIIGSAGFIGYLVAGFLVKAVGKRQLTALGTVSAGLCAGALYWSTNFVQIVALFATFLSINSVTGSLLSSIAVDLFPTSVRVMAVAVLFMTGRLGTVMGGVTFSYLLEQGCFVPFLVIGAVLTVAGLLTLLLPKTTMKKME